jgi:RNA polymerase sigma-54 factor
MKMNNTISITTSLSQRLTPQQIQYLKLLQLPAIQFEMYVKEEIEQNPMLDDPNNPNEIDIFNDDDDDFIPVESTVTEPVSAKLDYEETEGDKIIPDDDNYLTNEDTRDPFEEYSDLWEERIGDNDNFQDDYQDEDDRPQMQIRAQTSFEDDLLSQLNLIHLSQEEKMLGERIIGDLDSDGYFRRDLQEVLDETNSEIAKNNAMIQGKLYLERHENNGKSYSNPAKFYALNEESRAILEKASVLTGDEILNKGQITNNGNNGYTMLKSLSIEEAEKVLKIIQSFEPPGVAARNLQECLLNQTKVKDSSSQRDLALIVLRDCFDSYQNKHYQKIMKELKISEDELRAADDFIKKLNPKPGGGDNVHEINTVVPDFIITKEDDTQELIITINDSRIPQIRLNSLYDKIKKSAKLKKTDKDAKKWLKTKYEDAKFLLQAIAQRKNTMLKVMGAIAEKQKNFFYEGSSALKPLKYKDIADLSGLDISTVCRIVNGKYVQTEYGTLELKYFFSEALPNDDGDDVSNKVIKEELKALIDSENKSEPYSDEELSKMLGELGYKVARRTVAKYREQMRIPVARLRVSI